VSIDHNNFCNCHKHIFVCPAVLQDTTRIEFQSPDDVDVGTDKYNLLMMVKFD